MKQKTGLKFHVLFKYHAKQKKNSSTHFNSSASNNVVVVDKKNEEETYKLQNKINDQRKVCSCKIIRYRSL